MAPRDHLAHTGPYSVSFSELNTFATCEERWYQNYVQRRQGEPTNPMRFGTVMHWLVNEWWETGKVPFAWRAGEAEEVTLPEHGKLSYDDADWLMDRYVEHYTPMRESELHVDPEHHGETSLGATLFVPGVGEVELWGTPDGFLRAPTTRRRFLVERKTMADWRRMEMIDVTPQETLYVWLARENGIQVDGVLFDAIKNYRWTRDKHPANDSFQHAFLYRDEEQIAGALRWATSIIQRRYDLYPAAHVGRITPIVKMQPIKNLSMQTCGGCTYQDTCWESLSFPHDVEVAE